jgi:hypothetical protein
MKTRNLKFSKKTISQLSDLEQKLIIGGDKELTTSFIQCTGWTCCTTDPEVPPFTTTTTEITMEPGCPPPPSLNCRQ